MNEELEKVRVVDKFNLFGIDFGTVTTPKLPNYDSDSPPWEPENPDSDLDSEDDQEEPEPVSEGEEEAEEEVEN